MLDLSIQIRTQWRVISVTISGRTVIRRTLMSLLVPEDVAVGTPVGIRRIKTVFWDENKEVALENL